MGKYRYQKLERIFIAVTAAVLLACNLYTWTRTLTWQSHIVRSAKAFISDTLSIGHGLCFTPLTPVSPPLQTDGQCEADGAADGDVVEGVEQLREHQRVQAAVQ